MAVFFVYEYEEFTYEVVADDYDDLCQQFADEGLHAHDVDKQEHSAYFYHHGDEPGTDESCKFTGKGPHVGTLAAEHEYLVGDICEKYSSSH